MVDGSPSNETGEAAKWDRPNTATRTVGPLLLWRGRIFTPKPWPRVIWTYQTGWNLLLGEDVYGIRWKGWASDV